MKVLLFGASGQVGKKLSLLFQQEHISYSAPGRSVVDLSDSKAVTDVILAEKPGLLINAAAYTAVDQAQSQEELAFRINRDAPRAMAKACAQLACPMVHYSTDYVFDGRQRQDYIETDTPNPLNVYGASKLAGEIAIQENLKQHLIFRTSWVFSDSGNNFVRTILRLAKSRQTIDVVNDQFGCPTQAADLAQMTLQLLKLLAQQGEAFPWGLYHFSGRPVTTWYDFARHIHGLVAADSSCMLKTVNAIASSEYMTAAVRPRRCVLNCQKFIKHLDQAQPDWRDSVAQTVERLWQKV